MSSLDLDLKTIVIYRNNEYVSMKYKLVLNTR
jgi:hypothetical protein